MKRLLFLITLPAALASCSYDNDIDSATVETFRDKAEELLTRSTPELNEDTGTLYTDKDAYVSIDALLNTYIPLPAVYNTDKYNAETIKTFSSLANATDGGLTLLATSKLISGEIAKIIDTYGENEADVLFLIDNTGSMANDLMNVKKGMNQIIEALKEKDARMAIALYGDKNCDKSWYIYRNFEKDYAKAMKFLNGISVYGGGDYPESVYDGFFKAMEENFWKSDTKRMVVLIGDAPSLQKPMADHDIDDVTEKALAEKIKMNFYPIIISPMDQFITKKLKFVKMELVQKIYPVPTKGEINAVFISPNMQKLEVFNSSGSEVYAEGIAGQQSVTLDLGVLPNGVYVLRTHDVDGNYDDEKFVIMK